METSNCDDEETRSVTVPEPKTIQADLSAQWNYLSMTNNLLERGVSQSLLTVDSGVSHSGLFQTGDRFIPFRSDDTWNNGSVRFHHEENLLLSRQAKRQQRRNRRRNTSNSESSRSRSHSSSRSSSHSDNSASNGSTHASRQ